MSAKRENFVPDTVYARIMDGKAMFPTAVSVEGQRMIFTSGQLAWDKDGNTVGKGDMRAQFEQVGQNLISIKSGFCGKGAMAVLDGGRFSVALTVQRRCRQGLERVGNASQSRMHDEHAVARFQTLFGQLCNRGPPRRIGDGDAAEFHHSPGSGRALAHLIKS